eukprot:10917695-Alexandrium_andersonii.AAC.1
MYASVQLAGLPDPPDWRAAQHVEAASGWTYTWKAASGWTYMWKRPPAGHKHVKRPPAGRKRGSAAVRSAAFRRPAPGAKQHDARETFPSDFMYMTTL